jgi:D-arabinose 1-dehydrogenase-like Zn-dependent alcohol dehydrogenase
VQPRLLAGTTIERRDPTEHDVQIEILFCGICHSDLHSVRNDWSEFMPTVYLNLLALNGNLTLVGAPAKPLPASAFSLIVGNRSFSGSNIGGLPETQEMLDFCGEHNITADVEVIPIQKVNEAHERLLKSDVKYRFSIDKASLKSA